MDKVLLAIERDEIKKWLTDNDYKVNKIVIGEWTVSSTQWMEYLDQRQKKVARLNEILELLKPKPRKEE